MENQEQQLIPPIKEKKPKKKIIRILSVIVSIILTVYAIRYYNTSAMQGDFFFIIEVLIFSIVAIIVRYIYLLMRTENKKAKIQILGTVLILTAITAYMAYNVYVKNDDKKFPFKDCPHLLQSYPELVTNEEEAKKLLNKWIDSEYTKEEIGSIKVEMIFKDHESYFISLTEPLNPKGNRNIGYRDYKVSDGQIFGLSCPK